VSGKKLQIKLTRSPIGQPAKIKAHIAGLGLTRPNRVNIHPDTPAVRGMIAKVPHMVEVTEIGEAKAGRTRKAAVPKAVPGTKATSRKATAVEAGGDKETTSNAE
jgi:large subunit ribosomal protein L30